MNPTYGTNYFVNKDLRGFPSRKDSFTSLIVVPGPIRKLRIIMNIYFTVKRNVAH